MTRAKPGEALAYFRANVMIETDECKVWPYGKTVDGYGRLTYGKKERFAHVMACEAWHGPMPLNGMVASHGPCHNPACWNGKHLTWQTRKQDSQDRFRDSSQVAKLTPDLVLAIRKAAAVGNRTYDEIGAEFSVSKPTVYRIAAYRCWQYLIPESADEILVDRLQAAIQTHQLEYIGQEEGYDCGCNENGDVDWPASEFNGGMYVSHDSATKHVAQSLLAALRVDDQPSGALAAVSA